MLYVKIAILAILQGVCELLPVSSSAHVIAAERLMGLNPSAPDMVFLLIMLHTGTMFSVIVYFWSRWRKDFFSSCKAFNRSIYLIIVASLTTGVLGFAIKELIERVLLRGTPNAEIEMLFGRFDLIAIALSCAGVLIICSSIKSCITSKSSSSLLDGDITLKQAVWIGAVQGLCLPFRGFSRSGATISTGLLLGLTKVKSESFSFALAIALTPPLLLRSAFKLIEAIDAQNGNLEKPQLLLSLAPGFFGMFVSFIAGVVALRWLSVWLENGRWAYFGYYCMFLSACMWFLHLSGW